MLSTISVMKEYHREDMDMDMDVDMDMAMAKDKDKDRDRDMDMDIDMDMDMDMDSNYWVIDYTICNEIKQKTTDWPVTVTTKKNCIG